MPNHLASTPDEGLWECMPDHLLLAVMEYLQAKDLVSSSGVCKQWRRVSEDEFLWKDVFYQRYNIDYKIPRRPGTESWYCEYKRLHSRTPCYETEVLKEHRDQVLHVSFSHNGEYFATSSKDGFVKVLHVSFSHNGQYFATSSKDGFVKVWTTKYPCSVAFYEDMKAYTWKYTQFTQFNATDTLLLVSGVHFGSHSTSGEIAVFNLTDGFEMQCRVQNKPYDIFGTWYNNSHLISGNLNWLGNFSSCSVLWLNKASQELDSEWENVVMKLYRFHNTNASSIRTIFVSNCPLPENDTSTIPNGQQRKRKSQSQLSRTSSSAPTGSKEAKRDSSDSDHSLTDEVVICGQRVDLSAAEFDNIDNEDSAFGSDPPGESCDVTGSSSEEVLVAPLVDSEGTARVDRQNSMELLSSETCDLKLSPTNQSKAEHCDVIGSSTSKKTGTGTGVDIETDSKMADSVASANFENICEGVSSSASSKNQDSSEFHSSETERGKPGIGTGRKSGGRADSGSGMCDLVDTVLDPFGADASAQLEEFFQAHTPQFEVVKEQTNRASVVEPDKYLIFTTGSLTYTPHQIGIKKITHDDAIGRLDKLSRERWMREQRLKQQHQANIERQIHRQAQASENEGEGVPQNETGNEGEAVHQNEAGNEGEASGEDTDEDEGPVGGFGMRMDEVDHMIEMNGHIIGMQLSPDQRYLYVNMRAWPENYVIADPLEPPPIAQQIEIHVIDLLTLTDLGVMHYAHKAYTPNDECFFIFLDVCKDYVASGAEDKYGYLWDRHYRVLLHKYPHDDVVNSVAFHPHHPDTMVTVSDDYRVKVWRSRQRCRELGIDTTGLTSVSTQRPHRPPSESSTGNTAAAAAAEGENVQNNPAGENIANGGVVVNGDVEHGVVNAVEGGGDLEGGGDVEGEREQCG